MRAEHTHDRRILRQRGQVQIQALAAFRRSLVGLRPKRILDVGTGYGTSVQILARRFGKTARIWSVDASPEVLREVRRDLRKNRLTRPVTLRLGRAEHLPFRAKRFDLVVSLLALHHFSNPRRGLLEMARVVTPGGRLVVADWRPVKSPVVPHSSKDIPSPNFTIQALTKARFSAVKNSGQYWYLVRATKEF